MIFWFFCRSLEPAEGSRQKNKDVFGLYESADALLKLLELHKYDHFKLEKAIIKPLTAEARVTVRILCINDEDRVIERQFLMKVGLFGNIGK